ncbi:SCO2322 family protein [Streptomyces sp. NPDC050504]|uniref:SCO2322 family protein n=1 Tax=Streptomyces sp. NPDC050504 TaxID=3365618 RepID=UPI0037A74B81
MTRRRTVPGALVCALFVLFSLLGTAGAAQAAGYRYWSFWEGGSGRWAYATQGPATARPDDGAVIGFRFSVSEDSGDSAKPRQAADFDAVCAGTGAEDGKKRIAVVVDPGTPADAPSGETPPERRAGCAVVGGDATGADALAAVAKPLRYNSQALLCAISGYPKSGCGEQVSDSGEKDKDKKETVESAAPKATGSSAAASDSSSDSDSGGPSVGLLVGVAAVLALGSAALWQARRRRG